MTKKNHFVATFPPSFQPSQKIIYMVILRTIPKLRQQIFGLFLTHPPYVSMNNTERQQKLQFF